MKALLSLECGNKLPPGNLETFISTFLEGARFLSLNDVHWNFRLTYWPRTGSENFTVIIVASMRIILSCK